MVGIPGFDGTNNGCYRGLGRLRAPIMLWCLRTLETSLRFPHAAMRKLPERREKTNPDHSRQLVPERVEQKNLGVETAAPTLPAAPPARPAVVKPIQTIVK